MECSQNFLPLSTRHQLQVHKDLRISPKEVREEREMIDDLILCQSAFAKGYHNSNNELKRATKQANSQIFPINYIT